MERNENGAYLLNPVAVAEDGGTDEMAALLARRAGLVAELERIDEQFRAMEGGE